MISVRGFSTAGIGAGIKQDGALDLGLIGSEPAAVAAAVFTRNRMAAAPIIVSKRHLEATGYLVRAVLANSGNANAATGTEGIRTAAACARNLASLVGCRQEEVVVASTGVIGRPLPMDTVLAATPRLVAARAPSNIELFARAIMTTDTAPKMAAASIGDVRIVGVTKGAGMIHPNMATMLGFVLTDGTVSRRDLDAALRYAVDRSFNSISVDGDTSTNDMVLLLANGASGTRVDVDRFQQGLLEVCQKLAQAIVRDGEGASKFVELVVEGAPSEASARQIGRAIATSALVKTALHGADPNWGRIVAAIGNSGVALDSDQVDVYIDDIALSGDRLEEARKRLLRSEIRIRVSLHSGSGRGDSLDLRPEQGVRRNQLRAHIVGALTARSSLRKPNRSAF